MPGLTVRVVLQDMKKLENEALIVGFFEEVRPLKGLAGELDWLLCGALSRLILDTKLQGALGDAALLTPQGKLPVQKIFLVGLGPAAGFSLSALRTAAKNAAATAVNAGVKKAAIECFKSPEVLLEASVSALHEGLSEGVGNNSLAVTILAHGVAGNALRSTSV